MEYVIINGEPVAVPPEVVSEGREAVAAWVERQVAPTPKPSRAAAQE